MAEQRDHDGLSKFRDEALARQRANATLYDNSILALSSAFLAFSVSFVGGAASSWLLVTSWVLLGLAIAMTVVGIARGQRQLKELLQTAPDYYLEPANDAERDCKERALERSRDVANGIDRWNELTGVAFVLGVVFTILFAAANIGHMATGDDSKRETTTPKESVQKEAQPAPAFDTTATPAQSPAASSPQSDQPAAPPAEGSSDSTSGGADN